MDCNNLGVAIEADKNKDCDRGRKRWEENGFEEQGGYMAAKKAKLEHQFNESIASKEGLGIFNGVSIHINGYVRPPEPQLRDLFIVHGGTYHQYQSAKTTFVIASNLARPTKNLYGSKTVKPEWITDSIAAGDKLDHRRYFLYDYNKEKNQTTLSQMCHRSNGEVIQNGNDGLLKDTNSVGGLNGSSSITNQLSAAVVSDDDKVRVVKEVGNSNHEKLVNGTCSVINSQGKYVMENGDPNGTTNSAKSDKIAKFQKMKCITEEGYIEDFFGNSRLHLLSTHKKSMQLKIAELRKYSSSHKFHNLELFKSQLRTSQGNTAECNQVSEMLMHIDLDCFFVSVGLLSRPHLASKPLIVTHSKGKVTNSKSDIACASYEARKFGVKNGMWVSEAEELCPSLEVIPYDFDEYKRVSTLFFAILTSFTLNIEAESIDEMVVDVSSILQEVPDSTAEELAKFIREIIFNETKCTASIGIGTNKLLAKLAVKKAKPDGIYFLKNSEAVDYIANLPVREVPGIGHNTSHVLNETFSVHTCGDVLRVPVYELKTKLGDRAAERLRSVCNGIFTSELNYDVRPKSISVDINYGVRFDNDEELRDFIPELSKEICRRLEVARATSLNLNFKLLVRRKGAGEPLKYGGHGIVDHVNRSRPMFQSTRNYSEICRLILNILKTISVNASDVRGIGVSCSNLQFDFDKTGPKTKQMTLLSMSVGREMVQRVKKQMKRNQGTSNLIRTDASDNSVSFNDTSGELAVENNSHVEGHLVNQSATYAISSTPTFEHENSTSIASTPTSSDSTSPDSTSSVCVASSAAPTLSVSTSTVSSVTTRSTVSASTVSSVTTTSTVSTSTVSSVATTTTVSTTSLLQQHSHQQEKDCQYSLLDTEDSNSKTYAVIGSKSGNEAATNDWLPNQDPVDINFLKELPKHIALEIVRDYGLQLDETQLDTDNDCVNGIPPSEDEEHIDYTKIEDPDAGNNVDNQGPNNSYPHNAEMNPYQNIDSLDPSFLSALPVSVRNEVVIQFQQAKGLKGQYSGGNSNDDPQPCSSKQAMERDMKLRNGHLGPLGVCESVYNVPPTESSSSSSSLLVNSRTINTQSNSNVVVSNENLRKRSPMKFKPDLTTTVKNNVDWTAFWKPTPATKSLCTTEPVTRPALCSETELPKIRSKIREGIYKIAAPTDNETRNIRMYFDELVSNGWLSQVQSLVSFLQREVTAPDFPQTWVDTIHDIVVHVQLCVKKNFGGYLRFE